MSAVMYREIVRKREFNPDTRKSQYVIPVLTEKYSMVSHTIIEGGVNYSKNSSVM